MHYNENKSREIRPLIFITVYSGGIMFNKIKAYWNAFQAGRIASNCPLCIIDDENEIIVPCHMHKAEIDALAKKNEEYNN